MSFDKRFYIPFFEIKINDQLLEDQYLKSITGVNFSFDLKNTDMCTIQVSNCDISWIDEKEGIFSEGNEVEIRYGYHNDYEEYSTFYGEICSIEPQFPMTGIPTLTVRVYDLSHRLKNGVNLQDPYRNVKDSDIALKIAERHQLDAEVDVTDEIFERVYQKEKRDFQFLFNRAKSIGYDFYVQEKTLYFILSEDKIPEIYFLSWKENLIQFNPRLNTSTIISEVEVRGWDPKLKKEIISIKRLDQSLLEDVLSSKALRQISSSPNKKKKEINRSIRSQQEAQKRANTILKENINKILSASGSCIGLPNLKPGTILDISGLGERFSGEYFVTSSTHSLGTGAYTTNFNVEKRFL